MAENRVIIQVDDKKFLIQGDEKPRIYEPEVQEYKIRTVHDMLTCVKKESLDNFLIDMKILFLQYYQLKEEFQTDVEIHEYTWIDSGEHDCNTTIHCTHDESPEELALVQEATEIFSQKYPVVDK
jgi:hypothetical protein